MIKIQLDQLARFGLVGVINTTIGLLSIYSLIFFFNSGPFVANLFGYAIGLVLSYYLNKHWTFADTAPKNKTIPSYLLVATISYLSNLTTVFIGVHYFNIGPYLVQLFGVFIYTSLMFIGCKLYVFNQNEKHNF